MLESYSLCQTLKLFLIIGGASPEQPQPDIYWRTLQNSGEAQLKKKNTLYYSAFLPSLGRERVILTSRTPLKTKRRLRIQAQKDTILFSSFSQMIQSWNSQTSGSLITRLELPSFSSRARTPSSPISPEGQDVKSGRKVNNICCEQIV